MIDDKIISIESSLTQNKKLNMECNVQMKYPNKEENVERMFNKIAPQYDFLNRLLSARQDIRWRRELVKSISNMHKGTHLDIATGTGDIIVECIRQRKNFSQYIGADISNEMLQIADKK